MKFLTGTNFILFNFAQILLKIMRKLFILLSVVTVALSLSSCHRDFAAWNPLGFVPIIILIACGVIMTAYALRLTFRKK
jgi:hypothetical protein